MNLTWDRVILHTVVHHSSTSTYMPNFIEIEETFCGRTDEFTDGHLRRALLGRLCQSRPKNSEFKYTNESTKYKQHTNFDRTWTKFDIR